MIRPQKLKIFLIRKDPTGLQIAAAGWTRSGKLCKICIFGSSRSLGSVALHGAALYDLLFTLCRAHLRKRQDVCQLLLFALTSVQTTHENGFVRIHNNLPSVHRAFHAKTNRKGCRRYLNLTAGTGSESVSVSFSSIVAPLGHWWSGIVSHDNGAVVGIPVLFCFLFPCVCSPKAVVVAALLSAGLPQNLNERHCFCCCTFRKCEKMQRPRIRLQGAVA